MAVSISISGEPGDIWLLKNSLFERYAQVLKDRYGMEPDIVGEIEVAETVNGLSLDALHRTNPQLAVRVAAALRTVAVEIAAGGTPAADFVCDDLVEPDQLRRAFANLVDLLNRAGLCEG